MGIDARRAEKAETATLRRILKIIRPGDAVLVEQVEDRAGDGLVAVRYWREGVAGGQVAKGKSRPSGRNDWEK